MYSPFLLLASLLHIYISQKKTQMWTWENTSKVNHKVQEMKQSNILWWQALYAQVWGDLVKRQFLYTHILMSVGFRRYLFMNDFLPGCVCYCNLMFYDWNLEWMPDECTWHHKTFPVQLYWHLAIKLYLAPQNIPSAIVLTLGNKVVLGTTKHS